MCDNYNPECPICGCPIVDDKEIGEGCINGACPTNKDQVEDDDSI